MAVATFFFLFGLGSGFVLVIPILALEMPDDLSTLEEAGRVTGASCGSFINVSLEIPAGREMSQRCHRQMSQADVTCRKRVRAGWEVTHHVSSSFSFCPPARSSVFPSGFPSG